MKRKIYAAVSFILVLSFISLLFSGCSDKEQTYNVYYHAGVNHVPNTMVESEYEASVDCGESKEYRDLFRLIFSKKVIEIDGIRYEGTYSMTNMSASGLEVRHCYDCADGSSFYIGNDGQFMGLNRNYRECEKEDESKTKVWTQEECIEKAEKIVEELYGDLESNNYALEVEYHQGMRRYTISYIKYIGALKTDEGIRVEITEKGTLRLVNSVLLGCFSDDTDIGFDMEKVDTAVKKRLDEYYSTTTYKKILESLKYTDIEYEVVIRRINNVNQFVLWCKVESEFFIDNVNGGQTQRNDTVWLYVVKDHPGSEDAVLR